MTTLVSITALDDGSGLSRHLFSNGSYTDKEVQVYVEPTAEDIAAEARAWRDSELRATDNTPSDHSQYDAIIAYRVSLRSWPSQESFPSTKPTLGS